MIVPDPTAEVDVDFGDGSAPERFFLGDIRATDGSAWECCPREFLRRAASALDAASGLELVANIETTAPVAHPGPRQPGAERSGAALVWARVP